jgi:phospholipid-binding lipoprotein MlaA
MLSLLAGCARPPTDPAERAAYVANDDPLEPLNRKVLDFNEFVDRLLLRPVAKVYVFTVPGDARDALHRVLSNMKEPKILFNDVLQGQFGRAGTTLGRFVINSTFGIGGVLDVATRSGLPHQTGDFGQTLFVWGLPQGPYLVLPILGPSNPRDAIGMGVDSFADPVSFLADAHGVTELTTARLVAGGIDQRARVLDVLDDLQKNSLDFYAQLRSLSQQHRQSELHNGSTAAPDASFYVDPGNSTAVPPTAAPARSSRP